MTFPFLETYDDNRDYARMRSKGILSSFVLAFGFLGGCGNDAPPLPNGQAVTTTRSEAIPGSVEELARLYGDVLRDVVTPDGLVRYDQLDESSMASELGFVVQGFARLPVPREQASAIAHLCNAYNANMVQLASTHRRSDESSNEQFSAEGLEQLETTVGEQSTTLAGLRDRIRALGDPRVHAALVQAAKSSPPLRSEPYDASRIDTQLDDQCRRWLDDLSKNRIAHNSVMISEVFKWHADDFDVPPYHGVRGFLIAQARPRGTLRDVLERSPEIALVYIPFDWSLNRAPTASDDAGAAQVEDGSSD